MMKSTEGLPPGYEQAQQINLQKDVGAALAVNGASLVLLVLLVALGNRVVPISTLWLWLIEGGFWQKWAGLLAGAAAYLVLHEWVHGLCMKGFGAQRVTYGFTGLYAYAGSKTYFSKIPYIGIALAPVTVWGLLLLLLCAGAPREWFWFFYLLEAINLSGAAGDYYVVWKLWKMPPDLLVQDTGVAMTVYLPKGNP